MHRDEHPVVREMTSLNIRIFGIAECRCTGQEETVIKVGNLILYFGHESCNNYSKRHFKSLIDWIPISD